MNVRDMACNPVFDASGVRGFFGEGYWHHKVFRPLGLTLTGSTFVSKTATLSPNSGSLPLNPDTLTPHEWLPESVIVYPAQGVVLNAVQLSNPGIRTLLEAGYWQERPGPFFISLAAIRGTYNLRQEEWRGMAREIERFRDSFLGPFGIQVNASCPNLLNHPSYDAAREILAFIDETNACLDILQRLDIPVMVKVSVTLPPYAAHAIARHPACDALCVSNAIPWGSFPDRIDWRGIFGTTESPLRRFGGGALSGAPLFPLVVDWVRTICNKDATIPINAGGGILHPNDVATLHGAGASSVALGSVALLRPWRVRRIIRTAYSMPWQD